MYVIYESVRILLFASSSTSHCIVRERQLRLYGHVARLCGGSRSSSSLLSRSDGRHCIVRERQLRLYGHVARLCGGSRSSSSLLSRSDGLDHAEGASTRFTVASGGGLFERCRHGGSGVYLGDGQTEVYLKDTGIWCLPGRWRRPKKYCRMVDTLPRRMLPHLN